MVSFSTTDEKVNRMNILVKNDRYPDRSTLLNSLIDREYETLEKIKLFVKNPDTTFNFVNRAIDREIKTLKTRYLSDFIYYLGLPTLAFLGMVYVSLTYPTFFFFIIMAVLGFYIIVLFFLFYNKYRGGKKLWRKE